jgi:hypothetical protein
MNLRNTLKYRDMKAAVAGTQATHADPRSADEWIKKFLDDKNKRQNDLRVRMHNLLDHPPKLDEYLRPEMKAYGTSEGVKKEWDTRGRGVGQRGASYWKRKYKEAGVEMPIINYTVKHKSQYEGEFNLELNTSEGMYHQRGENVKDAKEKFLGWYLEMKLRKKGIEAAYNNYKDTFNQHPEKMAGGGKWAVMDQEGLILSVWNTQEEAEAAAWPMWRGIAPSDSGPTAGTKVKRLAAADIFVDEEHGDKTRSRFIKHPKPKVVKLADALRLGDWRPSSHGGGGAAGVGGTAGPSGGV